MGNCGLSLFRLLRGSTRSWVVGKGPVLGFQGSGHRIPFVPNRADPPSGLMYAMPSTVASAPLQNASLPTSDQGVIPLSMGALSVMGRSQKPTSQERNSSIVLPQLRHPCGSGQKCVCCLTYTSIISVKLR